MENVTTALDKVILAIVAALTSAMPAIRIFDGTPAIRDGVSVPSVTQYVVIAGTLDPEENVVDVVTTWRGNRSKIEEMNIHCLAVGRASRLPAARALAVAAIESVGSNLPVKPTDESWNALVSAVDGMQTVNAQSGATVHVSFTINVKATLTRA
jgi:hypothetical protein